MANITFYNVYAVRIPGVSLNDEGKVVVVPEGLGSEKMDEDAVNKERRKLTISNIPFSLTCVLHQNYILADPTSEEESVLETSVTVVLNSSGQLVSLYKPGGPVLAHISTIQVNNFLYPVNSPLPNTQFFCVCICLKYYQFTFTRHQKETYQNVALTTLYNYFIRISAQILK